MLPVPSRYHRQHIRFRVLGTDWYESLAEDLEPVEAPWFSGPRPLHRDQWGTVTYFRQSIVIGSAVGHLASGTSALSVFDPLPEYDHNGTPTALEFRELAALAMASVNLWRTTGRLLEEAAEATGTVYIDRPVAELLFVFEFRANRLFTAELD